MFQGQTPQRVLAIGEHHDGLYYFILPTSIGQSAVPFVHPFFHTLLPSSTSSDVKLWHLRLGHPYVVVIQQINVVSSGSLLCSVNCSVCPSSKQCKLPFPRSTSHAAIDFELVHIDV